MQRLKKCLGVDIGTTTVKIAELVAEKNGVRVTRLVRGDIPLPPGPMDANRINEISKLIRGLITTHKITTKQAVFSVPGQNVFVRRIRFPRTNEDRLHKIVAYEARQQIPFALENAMMEYQVFDYGDSAEVEVLLVAIKKDFIVEHMKVISRLGLTPVQISVTTLALFNFQVFDSTAYNEFLDALNPKAVKVVEAGKKKGFGLSKVAIGKKKKLDVADLDEALPPEEHEAPLEIGDLPPLDTSFEDVKAYVNIGASSFDLAIARHGTRKMLGFTRSVLNSAGNELTRQISTKLGVDTDEANRLKLSVASAPSFDSLPGEEMEDRVREIVGQWADRIALEIRKSFDFYIAQPDGMAVDSIVLSGGSGVIPGLASYLEDKLGIPVEVRTEPQNSAWKFDGSAAQVENPMGYFIALGLGLSGIGLGQVTVDFLPTDLKTIREFKKKNMEIGMMAAALLLIIGMSTQLGTREIAAKNAWIRQHSADLAQADADAAEISSAKASRTEVETKVKAMGDAIGDRAFWLQFMSMLESSKPAGIILTKLHMMPDGEVVIEGETDTLLLINNFIETLRSQKEWIEKADLVGQTETNSSLAGRPTKYFSLRVKAQWKKTRLAVARETLTPGYWTPAPSPTGGPGGMMDPMLMGGGIK